LRVRRRNTRDLAGEPAEDDVHSREAEWSNWMRAAIAGDEAAYRRLLEELSRSLRVSIRRRLARFGGVPPDVEDVVQETLLAIHLKRHTWDRTALFGPWVNAIAHHKLIDALRRRGLRQDLRRHLPIDDFAEVLPAAEANEGLSEREAARHLAGLPKRQRDVVWAIGVDGASISQAAARLGISEGAVRVALHRGLAALAKTYGTLHED
jgi:RNA polymerase sigma-70 factor (ECF subfamily)